MSSNFESDPAGYVAEAKSRKIRRIHAECEKKIETLVESLNAVLEKGVTEETTAQMRKAISFASRLRQGNS
jgi:hypothetical protein